MFQSFQLLANLTALENVMLPLELAAQRDSRRHRHRDDGAGRPVRSAWATIRGCCPAANSSALRWRAPSSPSPRVLLADEPTGSLDFATGETVMELMFDLNREHGTTLVLVTHDTAIATRCERRITIEAGRVAG